MKALGRKYDHFPFIGLYLERMALHKGLDGKLTADQHNILGLPSRTPEETIKVIESIRAEMARVGRWLADRHKFAYPQELEDVVRRIWNENRETLTRR